MPVISVEVKINWRYNAGSSTGDATSAMVADKSNEHAATVPTARYFELPKTAYIRGGTKLESTTKQTISAKFSLYLELVICI